MRSVLVVTALLAAPVWATSARVSPRQLVPKAAQKFVDAQTRMPLAFEPNQGQASPEVRWLSHTPNQTLLLTGKEALMLLRADGQSSAIRMKIVGAKGEFEAEGLDKLPSVSNYFLGSDSSKWRTAVPQYARVKFKNVYPGIDMMYYSAGRQLEYDFILAPGADPARIELAYEGADRMDVQANGDLVLQVNGRTMRQLRPRIYQTIDGRKREVAGSYRVRDGNRVEFALARYDRLRELVIDPVLQYSTFIGKEGRDVAVSIATDNNGDVYMTGQTTSVGFPAAQKAQQQAGGKLDAFIGKFTGAGDLVWMSYLGGADNDIGRSIAVDDAGNAYVAGATSSPNFPRQGATASEFMGVWDAFLVKISPNGQQFLYSTLLGGTNYDDAYAVAVDAEGNAYVAGQTLSADFPVRSGFQTGPSGGGGDTFVTKISTTRQSLVYSTYVGGNGIDVATGLAIDSSGNAYVTGYSTSQVFPVFAPMQPTMRGVQDAFLYKLNASGNSLVYCTFLGGTQEDLGFRVAVDASGSAYVYGYTRSTDFPTRAAFQSTHAGGLDAFVTKLTPAGDAIMYSTLLGGSGDDVAFGNIIVDAAGTAYIGGYTSSPNFPVQSAHQPTYGGGKYDAFVARLGPQGSTLLFSTYLGGSGQDEAYGLALDRQGQIVIAGGTSSANFPLAKNAFAGGTSTTPEFDMFLARLSADTSVNLLAAGAANVTFVIRPGAETAPQTLTLATAGAPVTFTAGSDQPWLTVSPASGTTPATLTLSINAAAVAGAATTANLTVNAPGATNSPITIPVTLNVTAVPVIASANPNPIPRAAQDTAVTLTGTGFQNGLAVTVNGAVVTAQFIDATSVRATIPASLLSSAEPLQVIITNPDGAPSPAFTLPFASAAPSIAASGIVNGASGVSGPIVPGQILTIYGTGFGPAATVSGKFVNGILETTVSETRVLIGNVAAPILSVGPNQVGAIVPYSVNGMAAANVEIEYQGQRSAAVSMPVGGAAPGLFTVNSSGAGQASAVNQDGSYNAAENGATAGSIITLFGTGEGLSFPAGPDGRQIGENAPRPVQTVSVTIGGMPATVEYAGGSPSSVLGLIQLNVRVPAGISSGPAVPVVFSVGNANSREGVTIAVR